MRNPIDLSLYLVLDANLCGSPEGMLRTALEAVEGGATVVQLRAPEWKKRKLTEAARLLAPELRRLGVPLIIDDHVDIALLCGADGVHVGQADIRPEDVRALLGPKAVIGLSVGSVDEIPAEDAPIDYIGCGPIFPTATKKDAGKALGLDGLSEIKSLTTYPIVAIGGIGKTNAASVMETGVEGIAVVSAICGQPDVKGAAAALSDLVKISR